MDDNGEGSVRVGGCRVGERGKRTGDWKRATRKFIEFLSRLISHIRFIISSLRSAAGNVYWVHGIYFLGVCVCSI